MVAKLIFLSEGRRIPSQGPRRGPRSVPWELKTRYECFYGDQGPKNYLKGIVNKTLKNYGNNEREALPLVAYRRNDHGLYVVSEKEINAGPNFTLLGSVSPGRPRL